MVVRNVIPTLAEMLGEEVINHNRAIFRGEGALGKDFARALRSTDPYAGVYYVEALIQTTTGRVVEILQPDPTRVYEREVMNEAGERIMVPAVLSERNPAARLAALVIDAHQTGAILDVIARDEITPQARAALRESVSGSDRNAWMQRKVG